MAQTLICDRCESSDGVCPVVVAAGSEAWTLDLCEGCKVALVTQVRELVPDGRVSRSRALRRALESGGLPQKAYYPAAEGVSMTDVRAWAKAEGIEVAETGRVAADVIAAYRDATGR